MFQREAHYHWKRIIFFFHELSISVLCGCLEQLLDLQVLLSTR